MAARRKKCARCKDLLELSEFNTDRAKKDGLCSWCKECKRLSSNGCVERKQRHGPRMNKNAGITTYRVVYDPCDSFSMSSEFTRREIYEMLKAGYLAIGTRFFRKRDKTYHEVMMDMKFKVQA